MSTDASIRNRIPIYPSKVVRHGKSIYYTHGRINAIFVYDMELKKNRYIGSVPGVSQSGNFPLFGGAAVYENKIYFVPLHGEKIGVWDVNTEQVRAIDLPESINKKESKYGNAFVNDGYLIMIPYLMNVPVLQMNLQTEEFEYVNMLQEWRDVKGFYIDTMYPIKNNQYIGLAGSINRFAFFDFGNATVSIIKPNFAPDEKIGSLCVSGGLIYVAINDSSKVYVLEQTNWDIVDCIDMDIFDGILWECGDYIIKDSAKEPKLCSYNVKTQEKRLITYEVTTQKSPYDYPYGVGYPFAFDDSQTLYFNGKDYSLLEISNENKYPVQMSGEDWYKLGEFIAKENESTVHNESELFGLHGFLASVNVKN